MSWSPIKHLASGAVSSLHSSAPVFWLPFCMPSQGHAPPHNRKASLQNKCKSIGASIRGSQLQHLRPLFSLTRLRDSVRREPGEADEDLPGSLLLAERVAMAASSIHARTGSERPITAGRHGLLLQAYVGSG